MLQLTGRAHDGALAIGLDALGGHGHGLQEALGHVQPHVLQRVHHGEDVGLVPASKRIGQHRADGTTQQRHIGHRPEFVPDFLKMGENASYLDHSGDLCNSLSKYSTNFRFHRRIPGPHRIRQRLRRRGRHPLPLACQQCKPQQAAGLQFLRFLQPLVQGPAHQVWG